MRRLISSRYALVDGQASLIDTPAAPIRVAGQPYEALPDDLYIPPDALRVFLEAFEGPLDLLLYLIRRQNLDILDIPVFTITQQYLAYIELMEEMAIELAGEYLLMAAMLAEIKSRMLLPRPVEDDVEDEADPRAELVRRLAEYERFKSAAEVLDARPRVERDLALVQPALPDLGLESPRPDGNISALLGALHDVLARADLNTEHVITRETLSVRTHMTRLLEKLGAGGAALFTELVARDEGRAGVVVSFLALLELAREALIVIEQAGPYAPLRLSLAERRS